MQVALGVRDGDILMQYAVEKNESRNAHICRTVDEYRPLSYRNHYMAEEPEITGFGLLKIHGDVKVGHAKSGHDAAFVRQRVVRCWQCKIDDRFETGFSDRAKLRLGGLTGRAEPVADGTESAYLI